MVQAANQSLRIERDMYHAQTSRRKNEFSGEFLDLTVIISASTGLIWTKLTFLESAEFGAQKSSKIVFLVLVEVPENGPIALVHRIQ